MDERQVASNHRPPPLPRHPRHHSRLVVASWPPLLVLSRPPRSESVLVVLGYDQGRPSDFSLLRKSFSGSLLFFGKPASASLCDDGRMPLLNLIKRL